MDSEKAKQQIKEIWDRQILPLWKENCDIYDERIQLKLSKEQMPQLYIKPKNKRKKGEEFEVHFDDGEILSSKQLKGDEILNAVVIKVGIDNVLKMNIKPVGGLNLISKFKSEHEGYELFDGYMIFSKIGNGDKRDIIRQILDQHSPDSKIVDLGNN